MENNIIKISRYCTDDGPGIRTVVFLKGCPLRCRWCHNPESHSNLIEGEYGKCLSILDIMNVIKKDITFYNTSNGGVTISGGEPLYNHQFTIEILKRCKELNIHTCIETSGFASLDIFKEVISYCDYVLFDVKETNNENHIKYTNVSLDLILNNLKYLNTCKIPYVIRTPIIPSINDRKDHFEKLNNLINYNSYFKGIQIMPYHILGNYKYEKLNREYLLKDIKEPSKEEVSLWNSYIDENKRFKQ